MHMRILHFMMVMGLGLLSGMPTTNSNPPIQKIKITDLQSYIATCDHPLIVNFWATFCVPCVKEIPYFQGTVERYKDKGVELVLVSLDLPASYPAGIDDFVQKHGYTAKILWLNGTKADFCPKMDPRWSGGIPASLFISKETHYRRFFDRQLTEPQVDMEIKKMIAPTSISPVPPR